ncbi:MAG: 3-isopropylmalate dehydratase small subunit [Chloroflexi bacterium]|nr:3-isopropylmalate dehydratase small subunit [Chloroflexota bacterium]
MAEKLGLRFQGRVWKFGDNISTDLMMPGHLYSRMLPWEEIAKHSMAANRPGWAEQVRRGDIIIARRNFGCGSSRPAPRILKALGITVVVAESMSRLFFRNAVNVGFPVLICAGAYDAFEEGDVAEVDAETGQVRNLTRGTAFQGEALAPDTPPYEILKAGGLDTYLKDVIARMKKGTWRPA